eukprot:6475824-Alexandrium_andersonii.AAC.1
MLARKFEGPRLGFTIVVCRLGSVANKHSVRASGFAKACWVVVGVGRSIQTGSLHVALIAVDAWGDGCDMVQSSTVW